MFLVHLILFTIILGKKYPFVLRFRLKISFINGVMPLSMIISSTEALIKGSYFSIDAL